MEAMEPCGPLPQLSPSVKTLRAGPALREVLRNKIRADAVYRECKAKHNNLVDWINADSP